MNLSQEHPSDASMDPNQLLQECQKLRKNNAILKKGILQVRFFPDLTNAKRNKKSPLRWKRR